MGTSKDTILKLVQEAIKQVSYQEPDRRYFLDFASFYDNIVYCSVQRVELVCCNGIVFR